MATVKDVARLAGVSTATVSHVLNNNYSVTPETRERVLVAVNKLNYTLNPIAKGMRSRSTNLVGFLIPDISNLFFANVAVGIENELKKNGYHMILCHTRSSIEKEIEECRMLESYSVSGMILAANSSQFDYRQIFTDKKMPLVFIDRRPLPNQGDYISVDDELATFEGVEHLIQKGHQRIGYIAGIKGISTTYDRLNGYKRALKKNSLELREDIILYGDSDIQSGYTLMCEMLKMDLTAVFVGNQQMAIGAMHCMEQRNVAIPDDMALMCFDNIEAFSITAPPLTSIQQPTETIGTKAARLLLDRIAGDERPFMEYKLPHTLIIRRST